MIIEHEGDAAPTEFPLDLLSHVGIASYTYWKQTPSTNTYALEQLARNTLSAPWLIFAGFQSAGRGRGENRWWSEDGSLTFSLVVDAEDFGLAQSLWPRLSMAVGLAICLLLEREPWRLSMQLKWPNDVFVHGKKMGGILIEHFGSKLVIGIGLNVNQQFGGAPAEIRNRASSLLLEMGTDCDTYALLVEVVKEVLSVLPLVAQDEIDLAQEAGERNFLRWKRVAIRQGVTRVTGLCTGIDVDGALLLQTEAGLNRVLSGTVEIADK